MLCWGSTGSTAMGEGQDWSSAQLPAELLFPGYVIPAPLERGWSRRASQRKNSPAKLSIRVGYGVEPIELGKRIGVLPSSSFTNGLGSAYVTSILQVWWPLTPSGIGRLLLSYANFMH